MSSPDFTALYRHNENVEASLAGDRAVLYHRVSRSAIVLNPSGTILWQSLEKPRTVEELVGRIRAQFPQLSEEDAHRDVETYLRELLEQGLIQQA